MTYQHWILLAVVILAAYAIFLLLVFYLAFRDRSG